MDYQLHVKTETPHEVIQRAIREGGMYRTKAILKRLSDSEIHELKEAVDSIWPEVSERITKAEANKEKARYWGRRIMEEFDVCPRGAIELVEQMNLGTGRKRKYTKRKPKTEVELAS